MNRQIEGFGIPITLPLLPDPDVLLRGGETLTFGETTIQ